MQSSQFAFTPSFRSLARKCSTPFDTLQLEQTRISSCSWGFSLQFLHIAFIPCLPCFRCFFEKCSTPFDTIQLEQSRIFSFGLSLHSLHIAFTPCFRCFFEKCSTSTPFDTLQLEQNISGLGGVGLMVQSPQLVYSLHVSRFSLEKQSIPLDLLQKEQSFQTMQQ